MFGLGYAEMMIVGVVAVLLFGGRLPSVARSMGKSLTEFKKGMQDIERDVNDSMNHEPSALTYDDYDEPAAPSFQPPTAPPRSETDEETVGKE